MNRDEPKAPDAMSPYVGITYTPPHLAWFLPDSQAHTDFLYKKVTVYCTCVQKCFKSVHFSCTTLPEMEEDTLHCTARHCTEHHCTSIHWTALNYNVYLSKSIKLTPLELGDTEKGTRRLLLIFLNKKNINDNNAFNLLPCQHVGNFNIEMFMNIAFDVNNTLE